MSDLSSKNNHTRHVSLWPSVGTVLICGGHSQLEADPLARAAHVSDVAKPVDARKARRRRNWVVAFALPGFVAFIGFALMAWLQSSHFDPPEALLLVTLPIGDHHALLGVRALLCHRRCHHVFSRSLAAATPAPRARLVETAGVRLAGRVVPQQPHQRRLSPPALRRHHSEMPHGRAAHATPSGFGPTSMRPTTSYVFRSITTTPVRDDP